MTATFTATATFEFFESAFDGRTESVTFTGSHAACTAKVAQWAMAGVTGTIAPTADTRATVQDLARQLTAEFQARELNRLAHTPVAAWHPAITGGPGPR